MATISARKRSNGTAAYTAQIRLKRAGKVVHTEAKTFDRKQAAQAWAKKREAEIERDGFEKPDDPPLSDAIDRYIEDSQRSIGKTKAQVLRSIKSHDIADKPCSTITSADILAFAQSLSVTPQTVGNYIAHLSAIFAVAKPAWGMPLDQQAMRDAQVVAKRLGVISKSRERDRRPTPGELDRLMEHFGLIRAKRRDSVPMQAIVAFAIYSTRRQEEITRVLWNDWDGDRLLVRDLKHPGEKIGNNQWVELTPEAQAIIKAQPKRSERIFPYGTDAISASFTRACKFLAIEDLHFHDLRHHGISRLFETGRTIPQAASVSAHRSWSSLKRYAHIRQTGDCMVDWPWLAAVT